MYKVYTAMANRVTSAVCSLYPLPPAAGPMLEQSCRCGDSSIDQVPVIFCQIPCEPSGSRRGKAGCL